MSDFFWIERGKWPQEAFGYVFLAQAVVEIGKAMYPDNWNGYEGATPELLNIPAGTTLPDGRRVHMPQALNTPWTHKASVGEMLRRHRGWAVPRTMPTLWEFSQDEWRDGISLAEAENQDRKARRSRFASVIALVKQASLDGELITALRPVAGGLVGDPLPVHVWNTENYQPRFHLCQMKPSDPFSNGLAGVGFQYILVSRESLDKFLAKLVAPPPPSKTDKLVRAAPQTKKYETWLRGEIDKSPHLRSLTHNDIEPVRERYKVSRDEAARIRRDILADKPDDVRKVWSIGGRTPGRKNHTAE